MLKMQLGLIFDILTYSSYPCQLNSDIMYWNNISCGDAILDMCIHIGMHIYIEVGPKKMKK